MDFYTQLTPQNVEEWYDTLPTHHRDILNRALDDAVPREPYYGGPYNRDWAKEVEDAGLGEVPLRDLSDGANLPDDMTDEEYEHWKQWTHAYLHVARVRTWLVAGKALQQQQKTLAMAMGVTPDMAEGLEGQHASIVRWLQNTGSTPLEFLAEVYRDERVKINDRVNAARALLDYVHRKLPQNVPQMTLDNGAITRQMLSNLQGLNLDDLEALEKILSKANKG